MLNVKLICVGKLKESYYAEACAEYLKRLSSFFYVSVVELPEKTLPKNPTPAQIQDALRVEGARITEHIAGLSVALCVEGAALSSEELALRLGQWSMSHGALSLIVGGSFGLDESLKAGCGFRLSMSRMTFPHHLARVMLLEQIYRAGCIGSGRKYHK